MKRLCLCWLIFLLCLAPVRAQTPDIEAKKRATLFVQKLQTKGGGFLSEPASPTSSKAPVPTLRATSTAVRALKYLGGEIPDKKACVAFVASCFDKASGGFADTPGGKADVFTTAVGLMAVAELGMPDEPYHSACVKFLAENAKNFEDVRIAVAGLERIKTMSPRKVEWMKIVEEFVAPPKTAKDQGQARAHASKLVTLLRLGVEVKAQHALEMLAVINAGQRDNGGYGKDESLKSDLETSYRVMRAYMMLKQKPPSVEGMRNFVAKCRNEDGGYGVAPAQPSSVSGTYFAAIIMHWLEDKK